MCVLFFETFFLFLGTEALLVNTNLRGDIRGGWTGLFSSYHRRALLIGLVLGFMQGEQSQTPQQTYPIFFFP